MTDPSRSAWFDRAYRLPVTLWGDIRIPVEIDELIRQGSPKTALELGCGVGRLSHYLAKKGVRVTGVDFSPVAIAKAQARVAHEEVRPDFIVGDVTQLGALSGPFDISYDVGCFHCLDPQSQPGYASEVFRLLRPGGTHLIWAMDSAPNDLPLSPEAVKKLFAPHFELRDARKSRRRLVRSHWYWLVRSAS